jgi:hypothetical protein
VIELTPVLDKVCNTCGETKSIDDFYNGHGACKPCVRARTHNYYVKNADKKISYQQAYNKSDNGKAARQRQQVRQRKDHPERSRAYSAVQRALKTGRLIKKQCEICGNKDSHAHHEDYTKPLDVIWLCREHHQKHHGRSADKCFG